MTLHEMSDKATELANALFRSEEAACSQPQSCIEAEGGRPLTPAERRDGWTRRPFWAYQPERMCGGCRAYFHAQRAAQCLHEMACWQTRAKAKS